MTRYQAHPRGETLGYHVIRALYYVLGGVAWTLAGAVLAVVVIVFGPA